MIRGSAHLSLPPTQAGQWKNQHRHTAACPSSCFRSWSVNHERATITGHFPMGPVAPKPETQSTPVPGFASSTGDDEEVA